MGFLSHRLESKDLKTGDHIYTWRSAFAYSHHGIYVGGNKVVHFTRDQSLSSSETSTTTLFSSSASNVPTVCLDMPDCGFRKHESGVVMSCLNCFLGHGSLYRFEYGESQITFIAKFRGGTCTTAKSDPPEEVIHKAMHLLHNGFGNYDLFTNNCEDFALYCKTGYIVCGKDATGSSGQASSFIGAPVAAIVSLPLRIFFSNPIGIVTATAAVYTFSRYATDIGVRDDIKKVKVEDMALLFHGGDDKDESRDESDGNDGPPAKRQRSSS